MNNKGTVIMDEAEVDYILHFEPENYRAYIDHIAAYYPEGLLTIRKGLMGYLDYRQVRGATTTPTEEAIAKIDKLIALRLGTEYLFEIA